MVSPGASQRLIGHRRQAVKASDFKLTHYPMGRPDKPGDDVL
jgi:hypothetical protein